MPQQNKLPEILEYVRTPSGVAFQLRKDPMGVVELPEMDKVLIGIHVGAPARVSCRRDGRQFTGTMVHGDIDIIPPRTGGRWEMHDENDQALILSLPPAVLNRVANDSGLDETRLEICNRFQVRDVELETICWAMKREMELGCPSGLLYLDGLTLALASRLIARHSSLSKPSQDNQGLGGRRLKQVLSFIEEQIADDLSLQQIAEVAGVSASHVKTLFRRAMGMPVRQYVIQRRVERAKSLLARDNLSMAEIAETAGFAHQSHMARHMRRVLGVPPKALRRLLAESSALR